MTASVTSATNMSGVSNSPWSAMLMRMPRPTLAPAHSATTAPMTASVTPTRRPPKITGSAHGMSRWRTRKRSPAPIDAKSSTSAGSTERTPTMVAIAIGKKTMRAQISDPRQQAAAEPDVEQRCQRQDRDRLRGDDIRREHALEQDAPRQHQSHADGDRGTDDEPEAAFEQRRRGVGPQRAGRDRAQAAIGHDLGRRQDVGGHTGHDGHGLPRQHERGGAGEGAEPAQRHEATHPARSGS